MAKTKSALFRYVRLFTAVFSLAGMGIMAYLTYIHFANARSFCDISETVSCDIVTTSIYAEILGIPISLMGLGYFTLILLLTLLCKSKKIWQYIFFLTILMLIPSLYFTLTEILFIKAVCILCETSKVLMALIAVTSFFAAQKTVNITLRMVAPLVITGVVLSFVIYFLQTGSVVKKDYSNFVACLNQKGVVYYKS